jgi:hypothetical protein
MLNYIKYIYTLVYSYYIGLVWGLHQEISSRSYIYIYIKRVEEQLSQKTLQQKIQLFENRIKSEVCSDLLTTFWHRKKHTISLSYVKDFDEGKITTKTKPIQMSQETMKFCWNEIEDLLRKCIIRKSKSISLVMLSFYVQKNVELERGAP